MQSSKEDYLKSKKVQRTKQKPDMQHQNFMGKISKQRNELQHKVSSKLISENQAVALETFNVCCMLKNHCLAQGIADASWSYFISKLKYKSKWYGKTILRIDQFERSTKRCNICIYHNGKSTLTDRGWQCPDCKTNNYRDINVVINIKTFALYKQNLIGI